MLYRDEPPPEVLTDDAALQAWVEGEFTKDCPVGRAGWYGNRLHKFQNIEDVKRGEAQRPVFMRGAKNIRRGIWGGAEGGPFYWQRNIKASLAIKTFLDRWCRLTKHTCNLAKLDPRWPDYGPYPHERCLEKLLSRMGDRWGIHRFTARAILNGGESGSIWINGFDAASVIFDAKQAGAPISLFQPEPPPPPPPPPPPRSTTKEPLPEAGRAALRALKQRDVDRIASQVLREIGVF
jgi:hypothetical protein